MIHKIVRPVILLLGILACNQQKHKAQKVSTSDAKTSVAKKDFTHIRFASALDLGCYMPIAAGLEDTAIVNGKVYGFCSKECKQEFMKDPLANIKAGEARAGKKSK